ncbi:MAG TPA: Clp protease N-terminal domain-containing protein, partial [Candidatus Limnocylindrales bacterium]|nr:Clp protease N-terminal domain-containing protein [Candidatus Limnocylindrales bacterium]
DGWPPLGAWIGLGMGLGAAVLTTLVLAVRRALEGHSGIDFADLATAGAVGLAVGLVPLIAQALAMRSFSRSFAERIVLETGAAESRASPRGMDRFDRFTERAQRVLTLAQDEAQRFNHNYIGTEHLLLGLIRETDGTAARALQNLGVELDKVRDEVMRLLAAGPAET